MYLQTNNYYLFQSPPFGLQYSLLDDENISGTRLQNVLQYSGQLPLNIRNIEKLLSFYCNFHLREKPKVTGCQIWRIQRRIQLCNSFLSQKGANEGTNCSFKVLGAFYEQQCLHLFNKFKVNTVLVIEQQEARF